MRESVTEDRSLREAFISDVNIATQCAIVDDKPLVILVEECCQATKNHRRSESNFAIPHQHYRLLEKEFVGLTIQKPSSDLDLLSQIFPQVQLLAPPSLIAIYRGRIIHSMKGGIISSRIGDFLTDVHEKTKQVRVHEKHDNCHQRGPREDRFKIKGGDSNSDSQEGFSLHQDTLCSNSKSCNRRLARKQYSQVEEEDKRKLKLTKLDRTQKHLEVEFERERFMNCTQPEESQESKPSTDECFIQVKLVDGVTKRMKFSKFDKLSTVREFILKSYKEYQQIPFQFFKTTERLTYSQDHEELMLDQLQLDRCTLILKPTDPFESNNDADHQGATSSYQWLKNKILSFFGYGVGQISRIPAEHINSISSVTNNSSSLSPILDSESDSDTIYHSPEIRSLQSRSSSPLEPLLNISSSDSNFDLNGVSSKFLSNSHYRSSSAQRSSNTRNDSLAASASTSSSKGKLAELQGSEGDESGPTYVNVEDRNDDKLS
ncbi:hypothetical protein KL930_003984 [Ogataea haglerorum]|uniref:UBX domain-containing protein n=1 Tax=Ogataea haglerorum TaxID=1937702 RepID=A0AAN6DAC0_9ASCO|nr:uncharacterized protein KL911_001329 [Ogataea haglerorum]KAG7693412.1 hypothetical protein KL915_004311 [Ogataea haglerorum]KAG7694183.1 hypothetical protein KL951_004061 [Ogataea haglerorum]KAG7712676.1 hypothetical protein KL950_000547 [Ogataea haglerorum]KAG7722727.1 hypothetical protein KL913_000547 [Ogataea haglerorum]KAG7723172.1 hypothetical protein KL949_000222 [Ogataea haglerorum]